MLMNTNLLRELDMQATVPGGSLVSNLQLLAKTLFEASSSERNWSLSLSLFLVE